MFGNGVTVIAEDGAGVVIGMMIFLLIFYFLMFAFAIASYVMGSLGAYTIAKRRRIQNPWLAWIPVGSNWIWGCISDQYQYVVKGKNTNRRKILLALILVFYATYIGFLVAYFGVFFNLLFDVEALAYGTEDQVFQMMISGMLTMLAVAMVMMVVAIVMSVFQYIALYDLFTSCDPSNNVLYLVLSILLSVCCPFLIFACRNKDLGMPPRKEPAAPTPAGIPE